MSAADRHTSAPDSAFRLRLLGGFDLRRASGAPVELPTRKSRLLLAYLATPPGMSHAREKLATLFWGDRQDEQARGSLRHALAALRSALGTEAVRAERETVELVPERFVLDITRLAELAAPDEAVPPAELAETYRGEFLEGLSLPSEGVADWLAFERTRCVNLAQAAHRNAIAALLCRGEHAAAIETAQRLLALDTLRERNHRVLIDAYLAGGERSLAAAQLQRCRDLLARELGVEPAPETLKLAQRISAPAEAREVSQVHGSATTAPSGMGTAATISIAVLPFANISGDPEQIYLAEGFAEDLVTELSRLKDFSVIARQSSALFAADPMSASSAAAELGVRYALAGSIRRAEDRLRITVQLIDGAANRCIWAERFDRQVEDIFAIQDDIVGQLIGSVDAQVRHAERERASRAPAGSVDAWTLFHRGLWHMYRFTKADTATAETAFTRAIAQAPAFASPYAGLGYAGFVRAVWQFTDNAAADVGTGLGHAKAALALEDANAFAHVVYGRLLTLAGDLPGAFHHLTRAIDLNPSFAQAHFGLAQAHLWADQAREALPAIDQALRLSPKDPLASMFLTVRSFCHYQLDDYAAAAQAARQACLLQSREAWSRLALAAAEEALGRPEQAQAAVAEARRIEPKLTISSLDPLVRHVPADMREQVYAGLRAAGLT